MLVIPSQQQTKMDALMQQVVFGFNTAKLDGIQQIKNATAVIVRGYVPNIVPPQTGWIWVDNSGGKSYISVGTSLVSDRSLLGTLGGSVATGKVAIGNGGGLTSYTTLGFDNATGILTVPIVNASTEYRVGNVKVVAARQTASYTANGQGSAYTGINNTQAGNVYAQLADLNALRVAYEALRVGYENLRTALQTHGLIS